MSRDMDRENELMRALRQLPVPPPSADFEGRVLGALRRPRFSAALRPALAAGVTLAIGLAAWISLANRAAAPGDPASVDVAAAQVSPVRLLFRSPRALEGVNVELRLPAGVELQGHPGRQQLAWRTDLQAGANLLELPVIVQSGEGGMLTAELSLGQDRKQFTVLVKARRPAVLYLERSAASTAAAGRSVFSGQEELTHA